MLNDAVVESSSSEHDAFPSPSRSPTIILGSESQIDLDGKANKKLDANGNAAIRIDKDGDGNQVNEANLALGAQDPLSLDGLGALAVPETEELTDVPSPIAPPLHAPTELQGGEDSAGQKDLAALGAPSTSSAAAPAAASATTSDLVINEPDASVRETACVVPKIAPAAASAAAAAASAAATAASSATAEMNKVAMIYHRYLTTHEKVNLCIFNSGRNRIIPCRKLIWREK